MTVHQIGIFLEQTGNLMPSSKDGDASSSGVDWSKLARLDSMAKARGGGGII